MKKPVLPTFRRPDMPSGCCSTPASRDFVFRRSSGTVPCCSIVNLDLFPGIISTEATEYNNGPIVYTGECAVTLEFFATYSGIDDDPGAELIINVQGTDHLIPWSTPTEVTINPGEEVLTSIFASIESSIVSLTAYNVTCDLDLGEVAAVTMAVPACCGLFTMPIFPASETDLSFGSMMNYYPLPIECNVDLRFRATYSKIVEDPDYFFSLTINDNPILDIADGSTVDVTVIPGEEFYCELGLSDPETGPGVFTVYCENLTCGTPEEVFWQKTVGGDPCCGLQVGLPADEGIKTGNVYNMPSYEVVGSCPVLVKIGGGIQAADPQCTLIISVNSAPILTTSDNALTDYITLNPGDIIDISANTSNLIDNRRYYAYIENYTCGLNQTLLDIQLHTPT